MDTTSLAELGNPFRRMSDSIEKRGIIRDKLIADVGSGETDPCCMNGHLRLALGARVLTGTKGFGYLLITEVLPEYEGTTYVFLHDMLRDHLISMYADIVETWMQERMVKHGVKAFVPTVSTLNDHILSADEIAVGVEKLAIHWDEVIL